MSPVAHQGLNRGRSKYSETRMEAICDESLWIWHVIFGCPGSFNDVNILNCSPLFAEVLAGNFPPSAPSIKMEGFDLKWYYWLVDGIYPHSSRFVTSFRDPSGPQEHTANPRQEAVRKSVERVLSVLFKRCNALYQPSRLHHVESMRKVVLTCVILHNMIVKARSCDCLGLIGDEATFGPANATNVRIIPKARTVEGRTAQWRDAALTESTPLHLELQQALKRHIWRSCS
jgi:Plant transposon protein